MRRCYFTSDDGEEQSKVTICNCELDRQLQDGDLQCMAFVFFSGSVKVCMVLDNDSELC